MSSIEVPKMTNNTEMKMSLEFVDSDSFKDKYYRKNIRGGRACGQKNIRCFPTCADSHAKKHFCGKPLTVALEILTEPDSRFVSCSQVLEEIRLVAQFQVLGPVNGITEPVSGSVLKSLIKTKANPTNPYFYGKVVETKASLKTDKGTLHRCVVDFNSERKRWNYASDRFRSNVPHVVSVSVMRVDRELSFGKDCPAVSTSELANQLGTQSIVFRPMAHFNSPSFLIASLRRKEDKVDEEEKAEEEVDGKEGESDDDIPLSTLVFRHVARVNSPSFCVESRVRRKNESVGGDKEEEKEVEEDDDDDVPLSKLVNKTPTVKQQNLRGVEQESIREIQSDTLLGANANEERANSPAAKVVTAVGSQQISEATESSHHCGGAPKSTACSTAAFRNKREVTDRSESPRSDLASLKKLKYLERQALQTQPTVPSFHHQLHRAHQKRQRSAPPVPVVREKSWCVPQDVFSDKAAQIKVATSPDGVVTEHSAIEAARATVQNQTELLMQILSAPCAALDLLADITTYWQPPGACATASDSCDNLSTRISGIQPHLKIGWAPAPRISDLKSRNSSNKRKAVDVDELLFSETDDFYAANYKRASSNKSNCNNNSRNKRQHKCPRCGAPKKGHRCSKVLPQTVRKKSLRFIGGSSGLFAPAPNNKK